LPQAPVAAAPAFEGRLERGVRVRNASMRILALIDHADVIERILKQYVPGLSLGRMTA
jgi:hypothetical protein